jgi:hypothetical protein
MKLPEIKNNYLLIILVAVIIALAAGLIYSQYRQSQFVSRMEDSRRGHERGKDDPYDRAVKNQILKAYPAIKKLYQNYTAKNPAKKDGNIVVDWSIDTDGEPERVEVVSSDLHDRDLEAGIVREIGKITFPEPPVKRYVTHTFRFKDTVGAKK